MPKLDIQLFTTPICPNCPSAKAVANEVLADREGVKLEMINAFEAQDKVVQYGIQAVPSFIINGCLWMTGTPTRDQLEHLVATGWECQKVEGQEFHSHGQTHDDHHHGHEHDHGHEHHH